MDKSLVVLQSEESYKAATAKDASLNDPCHWNTRFQKIAKISAEEKTEQKAQELISMAQDFAHTSKM